MEIGYTAEQEALRQELRAYYANLLTPEVEAELADQATASDRRCGGSCARWPPTAGLASGGPRSTAARAVRPSSSSSSSTSRCGPASRPPLFSSPRIPKPPAGRRRYRVHALRSAFLSQPSTIAGFAPRRTISVVAPRIPVII